MAHSGEGGVMTAGLMIVGVLAVSLQAQAPTAGDPYDAPLLQGCERTVAASPGGYFPVLVRLDGERLGAVLRGGAPHLGIGGRLDWVVSEDGGRTWGGRVVVADSAWDDRNPACHSMPDGTIVVAYQECHTYDDQGRYGKGTTPSRYMVTRSTDGGSTWSAPVKIDDNAAGVKAGWARVAVDTAGHLFTAWNQPEGSYLRIFSSVSTDGGMN